MIYSPRGSLEAHWSVRVYPEYRTLLECYDAGNNKYLAEAEVYVTDCGSTRFEVGKVVAEDASEYYRKAYE